MTEEELKREVTICLKLGTTTESNCKRIFKCYHRTLGQADEWLLNELFNASYRHGNLKEQADKALEKLGKKYPLPPYKGDIEGFPQEVVWKMLDRQDEQGNKRDITIFERDRQSGSSLPGFVWDNTFERAVFWAEVIIERNFELFFEKYPPTNTPPKKEFFFNCTGTTELLPFIENSVWIEPLPEETSHSRFIPRDKIREIIRKETKQKFKTTEVKAVSFTQTNKTKKLWQLK
jgi:hypothetical protein